MQRKSKYEDPTTRREFIKRSGLALTGATLGSLALSVSCRNAPDATTTSDSTQDGTPSATGTNSTPTVSTADSTTPPNSSIPPSSTLTFYVAPATKPVLGDVPGCSSTVAMDRLYSQDNMWVKTLSEDKAVVGITDALQLEIVPTNVILPNAGQSFKQGDTMGSMDGQKIFVDISCPVSGSIWQVNTYLPGLKNPDGIQIMIDDPYGAGWLVVMVLSKPDELKQLLSPADYIRLTSKA